MLVPGWDVPSSALALELADRYPDVLRAAVGIHPHHAADMTEGAWAELEDLAADARCVAVGEIGLDYFRNLSPVDTQRDAFDRQLALAERLDRPVLVHDRDAHDDVTARLLAWTRRPGAPARGVLHAFSGDAAMAAALTDAGFVLSFALPSISVDLRPSGTQLLWIVDVYAIMLAGLLIAMGSIGDRVGRRRLRHGRR